MQRGTDPRGPGGAGPAGSCSSRRRVRLGAPVPGSLRPATHSSPRTAFRGRGAPRICPRSAEAPPPRRGRRRPVRTPRAKALGRLRTPCTSAPSSGPQGVAPGGNRPAVEGPRAGFRPRPEPGAPRVHGGGVLPASPAPPSAGARLPAPSAAAPLRCPGSWDCPAPSWGASGLFPACPAVSAPASAGGHVGPGPAHPLGVAVRTPQHGPKGAGRKPPLGSCQPAARSPQPPGNAAPEAAGGPRDVPARRPRAWGAWGPLAGRGLSHPLQSSSGVDRLPRLSTV
ncbi:basic proline-rich protein-like [Canis lupus dingo]|uniref:basic proline-rich protein-like n=1 Tax=Canis lupus dingo TaxID=286419 RepID=UPI000DC69898|nr:basic proline-rich protein-like [Canis lupus dingo]